MSKIINFIKNISPFNNRTEMPKLLYVIKVILFFWLCKFGSEVVGEVIVIGVHFACGKNPLEGEMFDAQTITLMTYFGYAFIIGAIVLFWKLFQKKTVRDLGFTGKPVSYLTGALIGAALVVLSTVAVVLAGAISFNGVFANIDTPMVALMLICFVLQGAMEEILCRGIVHQLLIKKTSVPVTIGVSAALFTIPHLSGMSEGSPEIVAAAIANLILISVIFSLLTLRFKSIWAACGLHSIWNYILYSILGLNLSGIDGRVASVFDMQSVGSNILNGGEYGIEASIITTAVLAVSAVLLFVSSRDVIDATGR
ncbi:MAG: CPBP family intramembrane metalloprotease [Saccharofermentans sp.]|nr:CPBP family intramembrane metalloprotease [Saccharofermentans sp.]